VIYVSSMYLEVHKSLELTSIYLVTRVYKPREENPIGIIIPVMIV
jgi:hypothetical protein